jgi:hypothetical protein
MIGLPLRDWLHQMAGAPRSGQPCTNPRKRCRSRLHLETLEDRCLLTTVTNLTDHDLGSLRDAIAITPSGGVVDFQPGLTGTIILITGELVIAKDLTISGPGASVITVSGNHASRVFNIAATFTVGMSGLTVADGAADNGGGIFSKFDRDCHRIAR